MEAYREAINFQPRNFFAHNNLGVLYDKKGLHDAAIHEFESALAIEQGNAMALKNLETAKKNQAVINAREAKILQAEREAQAKLNDPQASYSLGRVYAFYGKKELAYEWLTKALKQGYKDIGYLRSDPALHSIRAERDFELLLRPHLESKESKIRASAAQFPPRLFLHPSV
jgi:tetratricopeptide (TPR) repeat protein